MIDCPVCNEVGGPLVECVDCGLKKAPRGRSVGLEAVSGYCGFGCPGYPTDPQPGQLWPGERYGDSLGHASWHEEVPIKLADQVTQGGHSMKRTLTLAALLFLAALPAAGQALAPGVGLVERSGTINPTKTPPGCPSGWTLNTAAQPWKATGVDPYIPFPGPTDPRYPEFHRLYTIRYAAGRLSTNGLRCDSGGTAGGDPHGNNGPSFLRALFASGTAPGIVAGTPQTHNGIPTAQELDDLAHCGSCYRLVAEAFARIGQGGGGGGGGSLPVSPGWTGTPIPLDLWTNARRRNAVEPELPGNCWRHVGFGINTLWYVDQPRCTVLVEPPEPPPPGPTCGDQDCDGDEATTCPADCPVVEPPPPPEDDACTAALDLLEAALETARASCGGAP